MQILIVGKFPWYTCIPTFLFYNGSLQEDNSQSDFISLPVADNYIRWYLEKSLYRFDQVKESKNELFLANNF